jgi:error-prone DNA polymerase
VTAATLERLAEADAFRSIGIDRRQALWQAKGLAKAKPLPLFAAAGVSSEGRDLPVTLPEMALGEHVVADYQTLKLSLKAHPMSLLREDFHGEGALDTAALRRLPDGRAATVGGVVLVRQRPGSAKGVVFITLEDEAGVANLVIWPKTLEQHRSTIMGARMMLVRGRVQRHEDIVHLIAWRIEDRTHWLSKLSDRVGLPALAHADEVARPTGDRHPPGPRHPRNVRVIPKSRDFH